MNAKDFDKIVGNRMNWCEKTLCAKGDEYARGGDRLWNFKVAARKLNCHPAEALAGMMVKHAVSVDDIIDGLAKGIVPPKELVAEKIGDSINYLLLLEGLVEEERGEVPEVDDTLHEGSSAESWQTAVSEQDTRRREQAATSAQRRGAMDALASACGYTVPPLQDGDDDPAEAAYWRFDARRNGYSEWKGLSMSERDAFKAEMRSIISRQEAMVRDASIGDYTVPPFPSDSDDDPAVVHLVPDKTSLATTPEQCLGNLCQRRGLP